ncbi:EAL and GGDEF domain-containing protein [Hylemonella gracilis]|uniref:sensor domain-containing protein n=1 Tax=Hylemonella gracilis TaxID=80880 RepID=UPI0018CC698D|nr:EAL domain-containing protein [Hylemonella gracilis]
MADASSATAGGPARAAPPAKRARGWGASSAWRRARTHHRVRMALYFVLLAVGLVAWLQSRQQMRLEQVRQVDADIIRATTLQDMLAQRLRLQLTRLQASLDPPEVSIQALSETVHLTQTQAAALDQLLAGQAEVVNRPVTDPANALWRTITRWQDQRERLWYRTQFLLWQVDAADAARRDRAIARLRVELDAFTDTLQRLELELQDAARRHAAETVRGIQTAFFVTLLLLLLLLLGVAEPLVRFVGAQNDRLRRQTEQRRQLALVAERTANWVAMLDGAGHVLWCNDAYQRGKGLPREQVIGGQGVLLGQGEDGEARANAVLDALSQGQPVRSEVLHRAEDGRETWLDVDYQPIRDALGEHLGCTVVATDITEAKSQRLRLRALIDAVPVGVVLQDLDGKVLDCNVLAAEMLGLPVDALVGRAGLSGHNVSAVRADMTPYPEEDRPTVRTLRTGQPLRAESIGIVLPGAPVRWLLTNTQPLRDAAGRMTGVASSVIDVTEQRDQQQLLSIAVESAALGVWQWNFASGRLEVNERFYALLGYASGSLDLTAQTLVALIHPEDLDAMSRALRANLRDSRRPMHVQMRVRHSDGRWRWMLFSGTVVSRDGRGRAARMAGVCYDVSAQKELEEQLRQSARIDSLTHLPNRAELLRRIRAALERTRRETGYGFAVLFMDFDRFKQVNDTLGHSAGDELLRQIAGRLQESLRAGDAFVQASDIDVLTGQPAQQLAARIGGDEFVVLLDNIRSDQDAQVVASRLLITLAEPYEIGGHRVSSTASIGIVTPSHMADDPDSVLRDADIAMYEAKRQGRGRYELFEPSLRKRVHDDAELENDLRQALARDEIRVVYQPLIDLATGRLASVEALARWHHPKRGLISPLAFIPVAEGSGLIGPLGERVLRTACHELVRLRQMLGERAPQMVSVNVSRAQLRQTDFVARLSELLRSTGIGPEALMLEVTESLAAQDEGVQSVLREVSALGVALSLDDFGTGYSSLSCLHALPVNQVKVDRSFVGEALDSNYHRVMIEATIRMAKALHLQTVAEGIETLEQAALMQYLGINKGQGYLYSHPLNAGELEAWAVDLAARAR